MATHSSADGTVQPTASHKCTTYSKRSLMTRILQPCLRPFRPRLVKPGEEQNFGSVKLFPPTTSCSITERVVKEMRFYDFTPPGLTHKEYIRPKHILLYFAGGGFQSPPAKQHWAFLDRCCSELSASYAISLVSYPLAPKSPAEASLHALRRILSKVIKDAEKEKGSVTLAGDSAGGNVALSLAFSYAKGHIENGATSKVQTEDSTTTNVQTEENAITNVQIEDGAISSILKNVLVISPPTDLRNQNPAIDQADRHDPILNKELIESVALAWAADMSRDSSELSPLLDNFSAMKEAGIKIHGVIGLRDVLAPDAILFREMCQQEDIFGEWMIWEGQMHCFPLAAMYKLPEGVAARKWVIDVLRRNA